MAGYSPEMRTTLPLLFVLGSCKDVPYVPPDTADTTSDADTDVDADSDADTDIETYAGPPVIDNVLPWVLINGSAAYPLGANLTKPSGDASETEVWLRGPDVNNTSTDVALSIVAARPDRLTLQLPPDLATQLPTVATLWVQTPDGQASYSPLFPRADNGFGGKVDPGHGLLGNVVALVPDTPMLPGFPDACSDPTVLNTSDYPCPYTTILVPNLNLPVRSFDMGFPGLGAMLVEWFAISFTGYLDVPADGTYAFQLCSDDGSKLLIDPGTGLSTVVDDDGVHGMQCQTGSIDLTVGLHPIRVDYFQGPRTEIGLTLEWSGPNLAQEIVPAANLMLFPD